MEANNNLESFNLNSELFPCVSVAMYGTELSPVEYESDQCNSMAYDRETLFNYYHLDYDTWKQEILERATVFIKDNVLPRFKKYGVNDIQVEKIWSPRYYNFHNDELEFTVYMESDWRATMHRYLDEFRRSQSDKFVDYILKHFHSCSGFCSLMPTSFPEIEAFADEDRCMAAYLTLCLLNEDCINYANESREDIYEWLSGNTSAGSEINMLSEYLNDDDNEGESYVDLYNNDYALSNLYHDLLARKGYVWRGYNELSGKVDPSVQLQAKNDAMRMIFWAVNNGYTVADLKAMAA